VCSNTCEPFTFLSLNGSCLPCHHSCVECFGPEKNSCTVCPQQLILEEGSCKVQPSCQSGEYSDGSSLECHLCHETCAECVGKGAQECAACFPGFGLEDGLCSVEHTDNRVCSMGEYYDGMEERCVSCPAGCAKCTDNITCTSCDLGHFLRMEQIGESQVKVTSCVTECPNALCTPLTSPGAGGRTRQSFHTAGLVVTLLLIVLLAVAMVGIGGYYIVTRERWRVLGTYKPVPNGELPATLALVEDSESGSEAELFAKEDA